MLGIISGGKMVITTLLLTNPKTPPGIPPAHVMFPPDPNTVLYFFLGLFTGIVLKYIMDRTFKS